MIHKFWNVRLASATPELVEGQPPMDGTADEAGRNAVRDEEERMEEKVYRIWSVLSTFEESSAACISDMLLHVSNGAYVDGVLVAKKFILHVDILFTSADKLDLVMVHSGMKGEYCWLPGLLDRTDMCRSLILARSEVAMQEDRRLLLTFIQDTGQGRA